MMTNWPALRNGCLILASLACGAAPVLAQSQPTHEVQPATAIISSVAVTQATQRASVRVEGEGRLDAHALRMQNPDRLVLDFAGTRMTVQRTIIPGVVAPVRDVRLGQYRPDVARVVIDLLSAARYQIARDGDALVISFEAQDNSQVDMTPATLTASQSAPKPPFRYADAAPRTGRQLAAHSIAAPSFSLPRELTTPGVVLASFSGNGQPSRPADESTQQAAQ